MTMCNSAAPTSTSATSIELSEGFFFIRYSSSYAIRARRLRRNTLIDTASRDYSRDWTNIQILFFERGGWLGWS